MWRQRPPVLSYTSLSACRDLTQTKIAETKHEDFRRPLTRGMLFRPEQGTWIKTAGRISSSADPTNRAHQFGHVVRRNIVRNKEGSCCQPLRPKQFLVFVVSESCRFTFTATSRMLTRHETHRLMFICDDDSGTCAVSRAGAGNRRHKPGSGFQRSL